MPTKPACVTREYFSGEDLVDGELFDDWTASIEHVRPKVKLL